MQNILYMPPATRQALKQVKIGLETRLQTQTRLDKRDHQIFMTRLERYWPDFYEAFEHIYGQRPDFAQHLTGLVQTTLEAYLKRADDLRLLDLEREITPDWFQREKMVGGIYYVDLFAGTLKGVHQHLDYIRDLGLNFIHLMPLLQPRPGQSDGGYAVADYYQVNERLGTMSDLATLAAELRQSGISLCIDLVVNHTAKEHEWAQKAMAGDPKYLDFYLTFDDRSLPDQFEKTLPEVFPDFKPGNFTYYPGMAGTGKWVWTTFNEFQWDLNYTNPAVFQGMLDYMLFLANQGVDVLRLDAVPFMWKRLGTDSQNQPEVHDLLQAWRALVRMAAPSTIFMAEAIVPPYLLLPYLGVGRHAGKECDIAYHNSLMVLLWSTLATRQVALMTHSLQGIPPAPAGTTWITYVRCHDDIGWAVTDENAATVGESGFWHRRFLNEFYSGEFVGSFARGEVFQFNPRTGDGRMSGMTASMAGLEKGLQNHDPNEIDLAIRRIWLLYSVVFSYGGLPLIYMGDEIGLLNDPAYLQDPLKKDDNRWLHRPFMPWTQANERHDQATIAGRVWAGLRTLIEARQRTPHLHGDGSVRPVWTDNPHVFAYVREHPIGPMIALCNFSEEAHLVSADVVWQNGMGGYLQDILPTAPQPLYVTDNKILLEPYRAMWIVQQETTI